MSVSKDVLVPFSVRARDWQQQELSPSNREPDRPWKRFSTFSSCDGQFDLVYLAPRGQGGFLLQELSKSQLRRAMPKRLG